MTFRHHKGAMGVALYLGTVLVDAFGEGDRYKDATYLMDFDKDVSDKRFYIFYAGFALCMNVLLLGSGWKWDGVVTGLLALLVGGLTVLRAIYQTKRKRKEFATKIAQRPEYWRELSKELSKTLDHARLGHFYTNRLK